MTRLPGAAMKHNMLAVLLALLFAGSAWGAVLWESDFDGHDSDYECCESDGDCTGAVQSWDDLNLYSSIHANVMNDNWGECNTIIGGAAERSSPGGNNRGFRIYLDDRDHPTGESSLGFDLDDEATFYIRWYSRFSFTPTGGYVKTFRMYCASGVSQCLIIDWITHSGTCQLTLSIRPFSGTRFSWGVTCAAMPVDTWVAYEMFIDIPNEQATLWVDGINKGTDTEVAVGETWEVDLIEIGGNQYGFPEPTDPDEETMDYDDVIVADAYIGLGGEAACSVNADCDDSNECTTEVCTALECVYSNVANDTACTDDALYCTGTETCQSGVCTGSGDPCSGGAACNDECQETGDTCLSDNGDPCTGGTCDGAGTCVPSDEDTFAAHIAWYRGGGSTYQAANIETALDNLETEFGYTWEQIISADDIINGDLVNADGTPRYAVIFFMGGSGSGYNSGLGETGKAALQAFVSAGGGYIGHCAGAFYGSDNYTDLWAGDANYTAVVLDVDFVLAEHGINTGFSSPLENVQYYNGCWLEEGVAATDYVADFDIDGYAMDGHPSVVLGYYGDGPVLLNCAHTEEGLGVGNLDYFEHEFEYIIGLGEYLGTTISGCTITGGMVQ